MAKQVYKNPQPGQPLLATISTACKTPLLTVKFCTLIKPFYYSNSPTVPRYSITCLIDPETHKEFLKGIQAIEKNEKVESVLKNDYVKEGGESFTTGKLLMKFQGKSLIPVYVVQDNKPELIELEDDLAQGEKVMIVYDILRYTKKNTLNIEHGLSFKPTCIHYFPSPIKKKDA